MESVYTLLRIACHERKAAALAAYAAAQEAAARQYAAEAKRLAAAYAKQQAAKAWAATKRLAKKIGKGIVRVAKKIGSTVAKAATSTANWVAKHSKTIVEVGLAVGAAALTEKCLNATDLLRYLPAALEECARFPYRL